jgi:SAM-dependent methyltransferase
LPDNELKDSAMEHSCRLCGAAPVSPYMTKKGYPIERCAACGFAQADTGDLDLNAMYDEEYFAGGRGHFWHLSDEIRPIHRYLIQRFMPRREQLSILEVGPGPAAFMGRCSQEVYPIANYETIELSPFSAEKIEARGYRVHRGSIGDRQIIADCQGRFDWFVGLEVIEHFPDPRAFARAAHQVLRPGGITLLSTGNMRSLKARWEGKKWGYIDPPAHCSFFGDRNIKHLFLETGFSSVQIVRLGEKYIDLAIRYGVPALLRVADAIALPGTMMVIARKS